MFFGGKLPNSLIASVTSSAAQGSTGSWVDLTDLAHTFTPASSASKIILVATVPVLGASDNTAEYTFAVDDVNEGPVVTVFSDNTNNFTSGLHGYFWMTDGHTGSTKFSLKWRTVNVSQNRDTARFAGFQVVEILG